MILYFIVALCTFTKNFSGKLKSQLQVIFGQDSFPLKLSPFLNSHKQKSINCLLSNGLPAHTITICLQKCLSSLFAST